MSFNQSNLKKIALDLLAEDPAPAIQVRILREVLKLEEHAPEMRKAREALAADPHVRLLADEQWSDGSWGRLHSRDSAAKQKIITTERGVARGLALGLSPGHAVLQKAAHHLRSILLGKTEPRDRAERNRRWPIGVQLFTAATLAQIQPHTPELDEPIELWIELARRTFASGAYDPEAEVAAHRALTGAPIRNSYLTLNNRYSLALLSARPKALPGALEAMLVDWVYGHPEGIKYLPAVLHQTPDQQRAGPFERWFAAHELMSGFPSWPRVSQRSSVWLWDQGGLQNRWDFGQRGETSVVLPLTSSWRRREARRQDWTARVVLLLNMP